MSIQIQKGIGWQGKVGLFFLFTLTSRTHSRTLLTRKSDKCDMLLRGTVVLMKANQHKEVLTHTREVSIYETWTTDDIIQARRESVKADTSKKLFMGGEGTLEMYTELTRTMVSSGGIVYVNVGVKNFTKKKITGIKLSLWRHVTASSRRSSIASQLSAIGARDQDNVKVYSEVVYKGEDYTFDNDDPRIVVLPIHIPTDVYSLRNTSYFHLQFFIQVSLIVPMSKALIVDLPIYITHASSWSDPPPRIPRDISFPMHEDDPVKKNKTGLFSKKKSNSLPVQTAGAGNNIKKPPATFAFTSSSDISHSAPAGKATTLGTSEAASKERTYCRAATRRPPLKDPDSFASVLDISQAGNLFVVNPDTCTVTTSSNDGVALRRPPAGPVSLSPGDVVQPAPSALLDSTSQLDRSTPVLTGDQTLPKASSDDAKVDQAAIVEPLNQYYEQEQDFDMSRSVVASPQSDVTKNAKSSRMGLRKTFARLSIFIPNQGSGGGSNSLVNTPSVSSCVSPAPQNFVKSVTTTQSPEEMTLSDEPRSPAGSRSLSRKSSGSSLASLDHDNFSGGA
ncbi:hypothetical protein BGZ65_012431, partial [Modicella reniformis]